jgi:hypothetical protein
MFCVSVAWVRLGKREVGLASGGECKEGEEKKERRKEGRKEIRDKGGRNSKMEEKEPTMVRNTTPYDLTGLCLCKG